MKYYNLNGTLFVTITKGLDVHYLIETVKVDGVHYEKLYVNFTFDSPYFEANAVHKIPLSRQQATRLYLHFLEREAVIAIVAKFGGNKSENLVNNASSNGA